MWFTSSFQFTTLGNLRISPLWKFSCKVKCLSVYRHLISYSCIHEEKNQIESLRSPSMRKISQLSLPFFPYFIIDLPLPSNSLEGKYNLLYTRLYDDSLSLVASPSLLITSFLDPLPPLFYLSSLFSYPQSEYFLTVRTPLSFVLLAIPISLHNSVLFNFFKKVKYVPLNVMTFSFMCID